MEKDKRKRKKSEVKFYWGNKNPRRRLKWKQMEPQEGSSVVKGLSRRVIVVKSPDGRYFEEAIFVLKDELFGGGADSAAVIKQARRVANGDLKTQPKSQKNGITKFPPHLFTLAGTAVIAAASFFNM